VSERFVKGKLRTETPRLKDLSTQETAREPSEGRTGSGAFAPGNRIAIGQGTKALIRKGLGDPESALVKDATRLYLAILRTLPSDGPGVRVLVASQARHTVLAAFYADAAAKEGLESAKGLKLAEASRSHDTTAQRLSVTAYDRAAREQAAKPRGQSLADVLGDMARAEVMSERAAKGGDE
jgi:hypothetical protein